MTDRIHRLVAVGLVATLALGLCPGMVAPATAGGLAPKKASDLRSVTGSGNPCPNGFPNYRALDSQGNADGTTSSFSVPVGSAFIVTSFDWTVCTNPGTMFLADAKLVITNGAVFSIAARGIGELGASGCAGGTVQIPSGVAVKGGSTLCFEDYFASGSSGVTVHGFTTKDR